MWEYALWSLAILAGISGLTMPQVLHERLYVSPGYVDTEDAENVVTLSARTDVHLPLRDGAVQQGAGSLPSVLTSPQSIAGADLADVGPVLGAKAAIVIDASTGKILWEKNASDVRPIASMTKLMSMIVAAQLIDDWDATHTLTAQEVGVGGSGFTAQSGEEYTRRDLLRAALVSSSNTAALALAHSTGVSDDEFAALMLGQARQLGIADASFVEPTGLSANNRASAKDVAVVLREALRYPEIATAITISEHRMRPVNNANKEVIMQNTNDLVSGSNRIVGGKTGFTYDAGYCLTAFSDNEQGNRIITVVMGADYETQRFTETQQLVDWTFARYTW